MTIFIQPLGSDSDTEKNESTLINNLDTTIDNITYTNAWGVRNGPRNFDTWNYMKNGDHVLFIRNGYAKYIGTVAGKTLNEDLSQAFWPHSTDRWECIYFLEDIIKVDIDVKLLNKAFGYEEVNSFRGFLRVKESIVTDIRSLLLKLQKIDSNFEGEIK